MVNLSTVNQESLEKAKGSLGAYLNKNINFPSLVNRLGALRYELVDFDKDWQELYEKQCLALEEVNALALDEELTKPLDEHVEFALKVIAEIEHLINIKLAFDGF